MKTIILSTILFLFTLSFTEAQINKGKMLIGVSTSFSYLNYGSDIMSLGFTSLKQKSSAAGYVEPDPQKITTLNLLPRFGYFIIDNLALGLNVCISSSSEKISGGGKSSMSSFGLGPFVRYYIAGSKVLPFFEVSSTFGTLTEKSEYQSYNSTYKSGMKSIGGGAGIAILLGDKVTFDMMAGYNSMSVKAKEDNPNNLRTVQGTIGFKFGFTVILGAK